MQELDLFVGLCDRALPVPYVPSQKVECERAGCEHKVWCDKRLNHVWAVLRVVCAHCAVDLMLKAAS